MTGRTLTLACALFAALAACGGKQTADAAVAEEERCPPARWQRWSDDDGTQYLFMGFDTNGNCTPDLWRVYDFVDDEGHVLADLSVLRDPQHYHFIENKRLRQVWIDMNHDAYPDVTRYYDALQRIELVEYDVDFDEYNDVIEHYNNGRVTSREVDRGDEGHTDVVRYYRSEQLFRIEIDANDDGAVETWHFYDAQGLARVGRDSNGDGDIDTWQRRPTIRNATPSAGPASAPAADVDAGPATGPEI